MSGFKNLFYFLTLNRKDYKREESAITRMIILALLTLLVLFIASAKDIKYREIPDYLSFFLLGLALGLRLISSVLNSNYSFFVEGLAGLLFCFILSMLLFYTGQWGGGDSKLLIAMGAVIGFPLSLSNPPILFVFLINMLLFGSFYSIIYSVFLALKNKDKFKAEFKKLFNSKSYTIVRYIAFSVTIFLIFCSVFLFSSILRSILIMFSVLIVLLYFTILTVKAIEVSSMFKLISIDKLSEGDWIVKDVIIDGKYVCGPKDLGIENSQIEILKEYKKKGKVTEILIKEGIAFVPAFLLGYIALLLFENWIIMII